MFHIYNLTARTDGWCGTYDTRAKADVAIARWRKAWPTNRFVTVRSLQGEPVSVFAIKGETADSIGANALIELATLAGGPIIVTGPSDYHEASIYRPRRA